MDNEELVRYISQGNKSMEMESMEYMNAIDDLCKRFEILERDYKAVFKIAYNNSVNLEIILTIEMDE